jgi:uncharacterized protein (TIGR00369 family)
MKLDSRERTYAWQDPTPTVAAGATQDGLSLLRAIGAGTLPVPPIMNTLAIEPVQADDGLVTFTLDPEEFHLNPFGIVHGGVLATMLDTAMGCAVHTLLPPGVGYVTSEMNVRFLRPVLLSSGRLLCMGEVVHAGRSTMIASASVVDADERLIAIAGSTCNLRKP